MENWGRGRGAIGFTKGWYFLAQSFFRTNARKGRGQSSRTPPRQNWCGRGTNHSFLIARLVARIRN